jgi:hypothetical protein
MALTGSFQTYRSLTDDTDNREVPWVYTLCVLVSDGGFARQKVIAVGTDREDLKDFLDHWIARNRHSYGGKYIIEYVPFVSETTEDA